MIIYEYKIIFCFPFINIQQKVRHTFLESKAQMHELHAARSSFDQIGPF